MHRYNQNDNASVSPSQILETFKTEFLSAYVKPQRMMTGIGFAVFADRVDMVSNEAVLFGGADFVRFKLSFLMPAAIVWAVLEAGGHDCLLQIVKILQGGDTSLRQAKVLQKLTRRFKALLDIAEDAYWRDQRSNLPKTVH